MTEVAAEYAKKHGETRWLCMRYECVRTLDQWKNIQEYFLKLIPKKSGFKKLSETARYKRISEAVKDQISEAYIAFCAFASGDFEAFLLPFQGDAPMIHLLYPAMCKLISSLMKKFIKKKYLSDVDSENVNLDVTKKGNWKSLSQVELGVKAKLLFSDHFFKNDNNNEDKVRIHCMQFYITSVKYLQEHLPINSSVIKNAQFLHPEKRSLHGGTSAISNLCLLIASVTANILPEVFEMKGPVTKESICDAVPSRWL